MTNAEQQKLNDELLVACRKGNLELVKELMEKGADVEARDYNSWTPLYQAVISRHFNIVKYLIEEQNADIDVVCHGRTPVQASVQNEAMKIMRYLIEKGAKTQDLVISAVNYSNLPALEYLNSINIDLNVRDANGLLPLHRAAGYGNFSVLKYLVDHIASDFLEVKTTSGETPLAFAIRTGRTGTIEYLFLNKDALMPIFALFDYPYLLIDKQHKGTAARSIFDYFLQNKSRYTIKEIHEFKKLFMEFKMTEDDAKELKPIIKFL